MRRRRRRRRRWRWRWRRRGCGGCRHGSPSLERRPSNFDLPLVILDLADEICTTRPSTPHLERGAPDSQDALAPYSEGGQEGRLRLVYVWLCMCVYLWGAAGTFPCVLM